MTLQKIKDELAELKTLLTGFLTGKTAPTSEQGQTFQTRFSSLETTVASELAEKDGTIAARDNTIKDLNAKLETAKTEAADKDGKITKLTSDVAAEKKRANEVLAAQGLAPELVPGSEASATPGAATETAWAKYQKLSASNPREAGAYWATDADKILASRPK